MANSLEKQLAKEVARSHFPEFVAYVTPNYQAVFHTELLANVFGKVATFDEQWMIAELPPRYGKTWIAGNCLSSFTMARNPGLEVLYTTASQTMGQEAVQATKKLIRSPAFQELFPNIRIDGKDTLSEFHLTNGSRYRMRGVGQGIGGTPANLLICDDLIRGVKDGQSQTIRDQTWDWFTGEALARLEAPQAAVMFFTRFHQDDPIGRLLNMSDANKWRRLRLPAIMDEMETKPAYDPREEGEPLWIGRKSTPEQIATESRETLIQRELEFLNMQKEANAFTFEALYQCRPTPKGGGLFKDKWFREYQASPESIANQCEELVISVDATFGKSKTSDYVEMLVIGRKEANLFLLDEVNEKLSFPECQDVLFRLFSKYSRSTVVIETKANGQALLDELRSKIPRIQGFEPGNRNKSQRAQFAASRYKSGQVYHPRKNYAPWIEEFKADLVGFGSRPHDDRVDALSQAVMFWNEEHDAKGHLRRILGEGGSEGPKLTLPSSYFRF